MTKIGRFYASFQLQIFQQLYIFLDLLKTLKTQRQKSLFLYKSDFHWQSWAMHFYKKGYPLFISMVSFPKSWFTYQGRNASQQCSAAFRKGEKKFFYAMRSIYQRDVSCSTNNGDTRLYMPQIKSMGILLHFSKVFAEKYTKIFCKKRRMD